MLLYWILQAIVTHYKYYIIIILSDHRRMRGTSLTETSLCGAYLYLQKNCPPAKSVSAAKYFRKGADGFRKETTALKEILS